MQGKHAYLIIAHNNFHTLSLLLKMLDDPRNDLYIHIDKRVKNAPFEMLRASVAESRLYFTRRIAVRWGHSSQVDCELLMLKAALKHNSYAFVHLISGVDLPIKSKQCIFSFFDTHPNMQFLQVGDASRHLWRLEKYNFSIGVKAPFFKTIAEYAEAFLNQRLGVSRLKKYGDLKIVKTSNWFSVTGDCAEYILSKKRFIKRLTRFTCCADEMFLGTVIFSSPFAAQVYKSDFSWDGHMRYIDRIRNVGSSPHTFTMADKALLEGSEMLFARKFDEAVDSEIIAYIYQKYRS